MSAPREHYSMRYTMPEHRIAHVAQNLFPKMQPIFKDSTNSPFGKFLAKTSSWETSCDLSFRSSWIRSGEGTQSGKVNFQIVTSSENYFTHGISKIVLQIVTSSEEQFG
ncbi:hypothetical protein QL285_039643 [Trifolium repens]|nr:hypothetical protein QL285_039643 [Trifolium repens]